MRAYPGAGLIAAASLAIAQLAATTDASIGVGFELAFDYAVSSVFLGDGTFADVAKIEAGPSYKHVMRTLPNRTTSLHQHDQTPSQQSRWFQGSPPQERLLDALSWRDKLPPWLGGYDDETKALIRMLAALKVSTESFLEMTIQSAQIAFPSYTSRDFQDKLRTAVSELSLSVPRLAARPAGHFAAEACHAYSQCPPGSDPYDGPECYPPKLVLTVEYSRASLDAVIILDSLEVAEVREVLHQPALGADAIQERCGDHPSDVCLDGLSQALREFTQLPIDDGYVDPIRYFSELVLLGEAADDASLNKILRRTLRDHFGSKMRVSSGQKDGMTPLYAASRGLALYNSGRVVCVPYKSD